VKDVATHSEARVVMEHNYGNREGERRKENIGLGKKGQIILKGIQVCIGMVVMFVVVVCILTLMRPSQDRKSSVGRRKVHHTDPDFTQSLLLNRLSRNSGAVLEPPMTSLSDIFISVKTSQKFHRTRLSVILDTWFQQAKSNTFFFTDEADPETGALAGKHLIPTPCSNDHSRQALCCKMQAELDMFLQSDKSWFCHFDDDQYVNVAALESKLRQFDHSKDWYLGKPSIGKPLDILDRDSPELQKRISFWFATGGAGFCLSKSLTEKMREIFSEGKFSDVGDRMRLPDDVTMGYVVEALAKVPMTKVESFHSHLEPLRLVRDLANQISFSYSKYGETGEKNVVDIDGFSEEEDPTRFLSIHCHLNPHVAGCDTMRR